MLCMSSDALLKPHLTGILECLSLEQHALSHPVTLLRVVLPRHAQHLRGARILGRDVRVPERYGLLPPKLEQRLSEAGVGAIERFAPEFGGLNEGGGGGIKSYGCQWETSRVVRSAVAVILL